MSVFHPNYSIRVFLMVTQLCVRKYFHSTRNSSSLQKIQSESSFDFVKSIIPNLMLSLRHIWTISNYFCQDEKMQILLNKISFIFTEKVKRIVTLSTISMYSASDGYVLATQCADLLLTWKTNYMQTRAYIERSEVGSRWEFNKNVLFDDVDHFARISNDIANISLVFVEFENIFKQKLQSLVYNPDDVDRIMNNVSIFYIYDLEKIYDNTAVFSLCSSCCVVEQQTKMFYERTKKRRKKCLFFIEMTLFWRIFVFVCAAHWK